MNYQGQKKLNLRIFCDASKSAKATSAFFRSKTEYSVSCQLAQTRNRVAPMKLTYIGLLKLLASCIEAKLTETVRNDLRHLNISKFFWTNSANAKYSSKRSENRAPLILNVVYGMRSRSEAED